jgi:signal transduction histidine kinase
MKEKGSRMSIEDPLQSHAESEIRRSDEVLKRCSRDLDAARNELDTFLYAVSHDLGAPLRAIQGFSRLLLEQYSASLDEKGQDYLVRIQAASRKIDQMVGDLLHMSRLAKEMKIEDVALSRIARGIADRLEKSAPERGVKFIVAEDIRAAGDEHLLTLVLKNLLDNAWKFTGKTEGAMIEFGVGQDGGEPVYFIRDNGIGFAMTHAANRLFKPFQKLHDKLLYPGSGIGLATVNRVIRRSGGEIWAESEKGKGTTIFFTLG